MISINEYATDHQVTYEAVRRQVVRYEKELAGHVITQGKKKYLDDFAVQFLDGKRKGNPIAVRHEVEKDESDMMKAQMDALKNELLTTQKRVIELQAANQALIEAKVKYDLLVESNAEKQTQIDTLRESLQASQADAGQMREELKAARADADQARRERDEAQTEAGSYHKSIFGFYRKKRS